MPAIRPVRQLADGIALAILAAATIAAVLTFKDYGLGWDDYTQSQYGDLLLKLYSSGFTDRRALTFVNLYQYGGGFDMAAALSAKILPFGLFETRRLVGGIVGIIGLIATWRLGRRLGGPWAGLAALALLAACPLYFGHMMMNVKDAPFAVAMIVLLLGAVLTLEEYPHPSWRTVVLFGIGLGTAFGTRVLAGLAAPEMGAGILLIVWLEARAQGLRAAALRLGKFLWTLLPGLALAYAIMALLWPWSVVSPLNPIRAALYFDTFFATFEKPWLELYDGHAMLVTAMPATYLPHLLVLKLPLLLLALGLGGGVVALIAVARSATPLARRAILLMLVIAVFLPIALAMITHPAFYNGVRHFVFVVPPFAVLGGLASGWLIERLQPHGRSVLAGFLAVFVAGIAVPAIAMARLHPYEYTYFNALTGGVRGAQDRYMLDYWGLAFKQAGNALRDKLADAHGRPPAGRHWAVAICGEARAARLALGLDFDVNWDRKTADFFMALGNFYCPRLSDPLIAEIKRDGITFARVYDLRGRPKP
jgi:Dolichyl-phosphate-mannose-protein mannosyltransferase